MWIKFFCKTYVWAALSIVAVTLCLNIEYKWLLIPGGSKENAEATNRIILALSYSYVAAAVFHFLVNYCPSKYRSREIKPFVNHNLWVLKELIRQCKTTVLPVFDLSNKEYSKEEYIRIFSKTDFYEEFALTKEQTKFARIEFYRSRIIDTISRILEYREYISDDQFAYLTTIQDSIFVMNGLYPYNEEGDNSYSNQDAIGECIFDLYEQSKST